MKILLLVGLLLAGAWFAWTEHDRPGVPFSPTEQGASPSYDTFVAPRSGEQIHGSGTVVRMLADDNDGNRHQRFILEVGDGRTLLIAHNIDLAPRIAGLKVGDAVEFYGESRADDRHTYTCRGSPQSQKGLVDQHDPTPACTPRHLGRSPHSSIAQDRPPATRSET